MTESIKAIEIKASILFNLDFANKTVLPYFFFFFLIIDLYLSCLIAELVIPTGMSTKEVKAEMETHPVIL